MSQYEFLWNGTEPGGEIHVHDSDCVEIWIPLPASGATKQFLRAIRSLLPHLSDTPPAILRFDLEAEGGASGGLMDGYNARTFQQRCVRLDIPVELRNLSRRTYRLANAITGKEFAMRDNSLTARIVEAAICNGIRTHYTTE